MSQDSESRPQNSKVRCDVCGKLFDPRDMTPGRLVRPLVSEMIKSDHQSWNESSAICQNDLNNYRSQYVQAVLLEERGELTTLEQEVVDSLREHEILAANLNTEVDTQLSAGQKLADRVAAFGGSWTFISTFAVVILVWIVANTLIAGSKPFDPYPFILLNLVLSCVAAVQAPIIMMSQNRQEDKDRLRAENDYRVNLKAELEIRHLHSKLDLLISHQWQRLLEIQQVQTDLLQELESKAK